MYELEFMQSKNAPKVEGMISKTETRYDAEHFRTVVKDLLDGQSINRHTKESVVKKKYNDMFWVRSDAKYEMQFATDPDSPKDHMNIRVATPGGDVLGKEFDSEQCDTTARIWVANKKAKDGPVATCYKLLRDKSGKPFWIKQTAREVRTKDGVDYWKLVDKNYSFVADDEMYQLTTNIYEASGVYEKAKQN